jgi:hypothetical protein
MLIVFLNRVSLRDEPLRQLIICLSYHSYIYHLVLTFYLTDNGMFKPLFANRMHDFT